MPTGRGKGSESFALRRFPHLDEFAMLPVVPPPSHPGPGRVTSLGLQDPLFDFKRLQLQQGYETVE